MIVTASFDCRQSERIIFEAY